MGHDIYQDKILIIDFGSQYTQIIARRVRELGVYCEIHPYDVGCEAIKAYEPKGIILSGGPESVLGDNTPEVDDVVFELSVPVLGICYGMQAMAKKLGGNVESASHREFGHAELTLHGHSKLFHNIEDDTNSDDQSVLHVWMSHGDRVSSIPEGFIASASTDNAPFAAMADEKRHYYGLQFHPEVSHTKQGMRILERFVKDICVCTGNWNIADIIETSVESIRNEVGNKKVLLALSGGVDSSVVAALLHKAIGKQLTCVFVDTGLLRLNEGDKVMKTMAKHMGVNVIRVNAKERFFNALSGLSDPEAKRKAIGKMFIEIFDEKAHELKEIEYLAQGTIYSDVIESAGNQDGKGHVIKSHHNVGGLPEEMQLKLIEPLRELFKDEVRKLGLELGLPYEMLYCHPFPGPGLAVRILGEVKEHYADILRQADNIFIESLREADLYHKVSQAFAVFLPVKSVAVMGDARQYDYVISLRAVETLDFMTAHWAHLPYDFLGKVSNRIINEVKGISRVTYDISGKPPATIEWE